MLFTNSFSTHFRKGSRDVTRHVPMVAYKCQNRQWRKIYLGRVNICYNTRPLINNFCFNNFCLFSRPLGVIIVRLFFPQHQHFHCPFRSNSRALRKLVRYKWNIRRTLNLLFIKRQMLFLYDFLVSTIWCLHFCVCPYRVVITTLIWLFLYSTSVLASTRFNYLAGL